MLHTFSSRVPARALASAASTLSGDLGWSDGAIVWVTARNLRTTTVSVHFFATPGLTGELVKVATRSAHTVADLEHAVASALPVPDTFRGPLWYGDVQLKRRDRLGVYRLPDNATLFDCRNVTVCVDVRHNGATHTVVLTRGCGLPALRQQAERMTGVPRAAATQVVELGTRTLDDRQLLIDQGVVDGTCC